MDTFVGLAVDMHHILRDDRYACIDEFDNLVIDYMARREKKELSLSVHSKDLTWSHWKFKSLQFRNVFVFPHWHARILVRWHGAQSPAWHAWISKEVNLSFSPSISVLVRIDAVDKIRVSSISCHTTNLWNRSDVPLVQIGCSSNEYWFVWDTVDKDPDDKAASKCDHIRARFVCRRSVHRNVEWAKDQIGDRSPCDSNSDNVLEFPSDRTQFDILD